MPACEPPWLRPNTALRRSSESTWRRRYELGHSSPVQCCWSDFAEHSSNCSPGCKATCRIAASRPLSVGTSLHFIPSPLVSLREAFLAPRCSYSMSTIASTTSCQVLVWLCMQMTLPSITASQHLHKTPQVCCKLLLMPWPGGEELGRSLLSQRSHR